MTPIMRARSKRWSVWAAAAALLVALGLIGWSARRGSEHRAGARAPARDLRRVPLPIVRAAAHAKPAAPWQGGPWCADVAPSSPAAPALGFVSASEIRPPRPIPRPRRPIVRPPDALEVVPPMLNPGGVNGDRPPRPIPGFPGRNDT